MSFPRYPEQHEVVAATDEKIWRIPGHMGLVPCTVWAGFAPLRPAPLDHRFSVPALDEIYIVNVRIVVVVAAANDESIIHHFKIMPPFTYLLHVLHVFVSVLDNNYLGRWVTEMYDSR